MRTFASFSHRSGMRPAAPPIHPAVDRLSWLWLAIGAALLPSGVGLSACFMVVRCGCNARSNVSARLRNTWKRSATWIAAGAPVVAPSANAPARSRLMTAMVGKACSQVATVDAVRSGNTSIG